MASNIIKCQGLVTYGNELSRPSGSLKQGTNINVDEDGVISPRRGFNDYNNPTNNVESSATNFVSQIMEYKEAIIRQYMSSLEYEDVNGTFQAVNGTFEQVESGFRTKWQEANSNLYFTSADGIKKISEKARANLSANMVSNAGGLKAGYADGVVVPTVGGFLPPSSKVGYRVLYGTKDNNNNLIYGSPSARFVVTNFSEDVQTYEISTITFSTTFSTDEVSNGDHFVYENNTAKYTIYFDVDGSSTEPKTAQTIGSTYVKVEIPTSVASANPAENDTIAAITANVLANSLGDTTVTLDGSDTVVLTSTQEDDIVGLSNPAYAADGTTDISTRISTTNTVDGDTTIGSSATVSVTGVVPAEATVDYFYQVYRTGVISTSTGLTLNDIDPGDEMNIVYEAGLTQAEIDAGEFTFTDTTPESFRAEGLPLYTNAVTGEGILQSNETPPIALDIELFRNYMFYANTKQRHKLEFTIVSVDDFISDSTRIIVGNSDITRFYTFVGEAEVTDLTIDSIPTAGDYINLYSANDSRQYYIYFGDTGNDPEVAGAIGYRVSLTGYTPDDATLSELQAISLDIESALVDNVDFDLSVSSNTITFTNTNNGTSTDMNIGADTGASSFTILVTTQGDGEEFATDEGGDVLLSGLVSVGQSIDETARSLVKVISKDPLSPVNAYYLSTGEDLPGNILLEARSLEDETFYIAVESGYDEYDNGTAYVKGDYVSYLGLDYVAKTSTTGNLPTDTNFWTQFSIGGEFTPELPVSNTIISYTGTGALTQIERTSHGYITGDQVFVGVVENDYDGTVTYLAATPDKVAFNGNVYECILDTTGIDNGSEDPSGDTSDNTYWQYISPEFSGVYEITYIDDDNFSIEVVSPSSTVAFEPTFSTIFSPDVESDNEELGNRIYFSKRNEPEAVPVINFIDVGTRDDEIRRILALRDELYIFKEDGIFVLSGTSAPDQFGNGGFSVRLIDNTRILAADSAVVLNNQIYCLTEQGVARISGSSVAIISRGIEDSIDKITNQGFNFRPNTFGISYENDRAYLLFAPTDSGDSSATQVYRYNIFEQTWSRWEYEATCGHVLSRDNKLYVGNGDRNYISQERKNNDRTDFSDRNFTRAIGSDSVQSTRIQISSVSNVKANDVIVQQQDVTINYINNRILKKMDFFDTGVTPPVGSTMLESFGVSAGDNLATAMQALNDYLRTLDAVNITAKSFTLSNIKTETQTLIDELNSSGSLTSLKSYKSPYTYYYEAYIIEVDTLRNIITVHTERPFIEGDIEVYKGYTCTVEWNPQHFGDPSALKQIRFITIMFDQNNFYAATAKFASDASAAVNVVDFNGKGIGYWGDLPWSDPNDYWGGDGNDIPFRNPVPRGKQKCRYLSLTFEHKIAREEFKIVGISGEVRNISNRAYRNLG